MTGQRYTVRIGGISKPDLIARLDAAGVRMNPIARELFASERLQVQESVEAIQTVAVSVMEIGLPDGATMPVIRERAEELGLLPCPIDVGPHLRLQYRDQPEGAIGFPVTTGQAPPGSITVVSEPLDDSEDFPKGFYLRRIEGVLWLRGYRSDDTHRWSPEDILLFRTFRASNASFTGEGTARNER